MKAEVPLVAVFLATYSSGLISAASLAVTGEVMSVVEGKRALVATTDSGASTRWKQSLSKKQEAVENPVSPFEAECVWLGKRIVSLLKREDVDTAYTFDRFYRAFNCPVTHLGKAFGCVVISESEQEAIDERIDRCWSESTDTQILPSLPTKTTKDTLLP